MNHLIELLENIDSDLHRKAAPILARQSFLPQDVINRLIELLKTADPRIDQYIVNVLVKRLLPEQATSRLAERLEDVDPDVRANAVSVLEVIQRILEYFNSSQSISPSIKTW